MGASVEINHVLAASSEVIKETGKTLVIKEKVKQIERPASENEYPTIKLESG